jgi:hypothetical protein
VSNLIPIVIALISVIGMSMILVIPTTTIPVRGLTEGEQCTEFPPDLFPGSSGEPECCPEGQVWETQHPGPGTYWGCEPVGLMR